MFSQFYNGLIRKYVITFGTLFNDIHITRTNPSGTIVDVMKVPIMFGPKEKGLARVNQDPNADRPMATAPLPLMSFEITGFQYDGTRKLPTINRTSNNDTNPTKGSYQYNPVPYNINFQLSIMCKNTEDGTKIVEQILPYFTPDWTVTAELIPEMNIKQDIPIILTSINLSDLYDGAFDKRRVMIWQLDFVLKGYFYGPVKSSKIIKYANTSLYTTSDSPLDAKLPSVYVQVQPGLTANGEPTSNSSLSIPVSDILATDDYGFVTHIEDPA